MNKKKLRKENWETPEMKILKFNQTAGGQQSGNTELTLYEPPGPIS